MKAIEIILGILVVIVAFGGLFYWISSYMSNSTDKINEKTDGFLSGSSAVGNLYDMKSVVDDNGITVYQGNQVGIEIPVSNINKSEDVVVTFLVDEGTGVKSNKVITFNDASTNKILSSALGFNGGSKVKLWINNTNVDGVNFHEILSVSYDGITYNVQ